MGKRKKKPFINKKEAQTYRLVPRSHNDPKAGDMEEAQYVLKPEERLAEGNRHTEQKKFGISFEDEYDYLQHLEAPASRTSELVGLRGKNEASLPEEFFGEEVAVQGNLERVLPVSGPHPHWDPEIVEAIENAEARSKVNELEDDFFQMANSGEPGLPVHVMEQQDDNVADRHWWKGRGDFEQPQSPTHSAEPSGESSDDESAASVSSGGDSTLGSLERCSEKGMAQFTEYSMTSSVVPRSEALTLLDDRFEEFMAEYSDEQLGAGGEAGGEGVAEGACPDSKQSEYDRMLLQTAMEDFDKNFKEDVEDVDGAGVCYVSAKDKEGEEPGVESEEDEGSGDGSTEEEESDDKEERDIIEMDETRKEDRLDCESILSTYSTLYNHPTRIVEPRRARVSSGDQEIKLSRKTGMPLGVIPGPLPKENHPSKGTITRPKDESKGEKRARKLGMKEDRKQRRADKKATKLAFKAEAMKQGKTVLNSSTRIATVV